MSRDATTAFARTLVDEWSRGGVTDAVLAPGSRSAPVALALADDHRLRLHVFLDERSAAFFALGLAKRSARPAILLCTSGTAAANFHPAVAEASHGRVPMIVCTADRPPELRGVGAGQTIDQERLYGSAVRWFCEAGVPADEPGAGARWRELAARSVQVALGAPAGPVHLNLAFREPLVPSGEPLVDVPGSPHGAPWPVAVPEPEQGGHDEEMAAQLRAFVAEHERGLVSVGWGARVDRGALARFSAWSGWPVLADPISGLRVPGTISTYDALLRDPSFASAHCPDGVLRLGAPLTGRIAAQWLDRAPALLVDPDGVWLDPGRAAVDRLRCDVGGVLDSVPAAPPRETAPTGAPSDGWSGAWNEADDRARRAIDEVLDGWDEPFEGRVARDVLAGMPDDSTLVVASSMPVRDLESFGTPRTGVRVLANRGVNGIDGFTSTALGIAAAVPDPAVALVGDLCFLHDTNGLLGAAARDLDLTFVVVDNDGGGIFSFLPQAALPEHFETLFGTPQRVDLGLLLAAHAIPLVEVGTARELVPSIVSSVGAGGVRVVRIRTDADGQCRAPS